MSGTTEIILKDEIKKIRQKSKKNKQQKDLIWRRLCSVAATSGSSLNVDKFMDLYDDRLSFNKLPNSEKDRLKIFKKALEDAKVPRMRNIKAKALSSNYNKISKMGGPEKVTKIMLALKGKEEKIKWIKQFAGVGEKYSRDIWMDIADEDFNNSIALDTRVKNFAEKIGLDKKSKNLESELLTFAEECNLTGWELDRLIYNFGDLILKVALS